MTTHDAPLFPDEAAPRRGRRLMVLAAVLVVAVLAAAVGTSVASSDGTAQLVTATAGVHDVVAELHGVATIEPVVQAAVSFPADGTVASLDVAVGETVTVGQQLASLDLDALTKQLHAAEATLAEAELSLQKALDGESVDESGASGATSAAPASTTTATTAAVLAVATTANTPTAADDQLAALQQAVLDAQQAVDSALVASEAALAAAEEVCAASGAADAAEDPGDSTTTTSDDGSGADACRTALDEVLLAQQATAAAQRQLADASSALDAYVLAQSATGAGGSGGTASSGGSGTAPGGSSSSGSGSSASTSPSSAQLIALQQQVDAAALGVAVAQQAIAQASIVSPIAGTVVAVGFEVGDEVTAASSTQTVIVQGDDGMEAVTTVALSDVASVRVGQVAMVVPDGSEEALAGEVVAVAAVPDDDAATTSYRVTIGFAHGGDALGNGTTGSVTIVTDEVESALSVPTSAITWQNGRAVVGVVTDGVAASTNVEIGVVGSEWTAITSGVAEGDVVVLADPDEPLPGSATDTTQSSSGATSPFGAGGGGMPSGGFPSGGMGGRPGGS